MMEDMMTRRTVDLHGKCWWHISRIGDGISMLSTRKVKWFNAIADTAQSLEEEEEKTHIYQEMILLKVVLDLDETLACAYETSSMPDSVRKQATDAGLTWNLMENPRSAMSRSLNVLDCTSFLPNFANLLILCYLLQALKDMRETTC